MYSNVGIDLLNCTSQNHFAMDQCNNSIKVLTGLFAVLETFVIDSPYPLFHTIQFSQKIYQVVLCNMGEHLFDYGETEKALNYVEKGIAFSLKMHNLRFLPDLSYMKFKILYFQQKYQEARDYYNRSIYLYKLTNKETILAELENSSRTDYPEIFKEQYT